MTALATPLLILAAFGSVFLAFKGNGAIAIMHHPVALWSGGVCAVLMLVLTLRALLRRRWLSALFHGAFGYLLVGVLLSANAGRSGPDSGYLPLAKGYYDTRLYPKDDLNTPFADLPFTVTLNDFTLDYYPQNNADQSELEAAVALVSPEGQRVFQSRVTEKTGIAFGEWGIDLVSYLTYPDENGTPAYYGILHLTRPATDTRAAVDGYLPLASGQQNSALYDAALNTMLARLPFTVVMESFAITPLVPRQYYADITLTPADGSDERRATISVNNPLRFQGWTVYQMSYGEHPDPYTGGSAFYTILFLSRDPGVTHVFAAFALILLATAALMIHTVRRQFRKEAPCR